MQPLAIDLAEVSKTYRGRVQALRGVSMQVSAGEVFGLLGPNGAGKSTLVKILTTVVRPTACRGRMLGAPVGHKPTLRRVGYLPEHHKFPEYLTGSQVLDFYGALAKVPRAQRRRRTEELLEIVGLSAWRHKKAGGFSKGMRQRLGIAQALINDPDLVMLDEPTDGVDPVGRRDIRSLLVELKGRGKTVFLNSHLLSELEMVCDRVAIMVKGVVVSQGTIDELTAYGRRYEIEVQPAAGASGSLPAALRRAGLAGAAPGDAPRLASGASVEVEGPVLRVGTSEPEAVQGVIDALRAEGLTIRSVRQIRPSLEDLFMRAVTDPVTGRTLSPGAHVAGAPADPAGPPPAEAR
ncbi:MAG TPA: ABC transporter ATP-binding protein [Phycisphaerales bacterium]|nr:ABC transporter ATP-binding protein [Phycisphaerales bacterium]